MSQLKYYNTTSGQWEPAIVGATGPTGATGPAGKFTVSDTAPSSPSAGDAWFDSSTGSFFVYYTDANSSQWVEAQANTGINDAVSSRVGVLETLTTKFPQSYNYVINGAFDIWQRGTSFAAQPHNAYGADRWKIFFDGTGGARTISRQAFTPGTAPDSSFEATYFYRYQQTTAGTGGTYNDVAVQMIEDVRTLAGKIVTVSFWAKSDSARNLTWYLGQYFGSGGTPSATVYTQGPSTIPVTTSWARYSATVTLPSLSGKTLGTGGDHALQVLIRSLTANATQTVDIFGVQIEEGSTATPFRRNAPSIQAELAACQRYYQKLDYTEAGGTTYVTVCQATAATSALGVIPLVTSMRVPPTSVAFGAAVGNFSLGNASATALTVTAATLTAPTTKSLKLILTVASGLVAGNASILYTSTGYITADAEL